MRLEGSAKAFFPETVQLAYAMGWVVNDYRGLKLTRSRRTSSTGTAFKITLVPDKGLGIVVLTNLHDTRMPMAVTNTLD